MKKRPASRTNAQKVNKKPAGHPGGALKKKPAKRSNEKPFNNGWLMVVDPKTLRILAAEQMHEPESNSVVSQTLEKVIDLYPAADAFIYDRNCKYYQTASMRPSFA
eukprot:795062-Karenia_brevis.AAC.1